MRQRLKVTAQGLVTSDHLVRLRGWRSRRRYPDSLRRIRYRDPESGRILVFLTNDQTLSAELIALLYRKRWQIELFFKWIKQHLRIKAFLGTSENAVKTQIWIAVSVYVLVAIIKKHFQLPASLHDLLQILSVTLFEREPIDQVLTLAASEPHALDYSNQLTLFDF